MATPSADSFAPRLADDDMANSPSDVGAADESGVNLLRFYPVMCTLDFGFWGEVNSSKILRWRLETPIVPVTALLVPLQPSNASASNDSKRRAVGSIGWRLHLEKDAFHPLDQQPVNDLSISENPSLSQSFLVHGLFFNANSAEDFRRIHRQYFVERLVSSMTKSLESTSNLLESSATKIFHSINVELHAKFDITKIDEMELQLTSPPPLLQCLSSSNNIISHLTSFLILSFADLKSYLYYYNVALPALRPTKDISATIQPCSSLPFNLSYIHLAAVGEALLRTSSERRVGFSGVCVLIRRKLESTGVQPAEGRISGVKKSPDIYDDWDWLASFFNDQLPTGQSCSCPIDDDTVIVPLWNVLLRYRVFQLLLPSRSLSASDFCLTTLTTEGIVCVVDAVKSENKTSFGWPLRSVLFALGYLGLAGQKLRLLTYRDGPSGVLNFRQFNESTLSTVQHTDGQIPVVASVGLVIDMPTIDCFMFEHIQTTTGDIPPMCLIQQDSKLKLNGSKRDPVVSGWLRILTPKDRSQNTQSSSSVTFLVDLRHHMNPIVSQADAVQLNIRLIQWRILPTLDVNKLQKLRFLLLGIGTLGCNILRTLVAWGVTQLTLVDCGRVTLSSPVRQTLFIHEDASWNNGRGRLKVVAAKRRLLDIRPDLSINALTMDIPMPGHSRYLSSFGHNFGTSISNSGTSGLSESPVSPSFTKPLESLNGTLELLERLVDTHDVVLLLTDSRESRWLPSMLVSSRPFRGNSNFVDPLSHTSEVKPLPVQPPLPDEFNLSSDEMIGSGGGREGNERINLSDHSYLRDSESWNTLFSSPPTFKVPLCVTVALGFDTFVVMRHGQRRPKQLPFHSSAYSDVQKTKEKDEIRDEDVSSPVSSAVSTPGLLACYFCNDLTAPADSLARRPLDQQCTVTRPGISGLASNVAAELIAAVSQHPEAPDPPHCGVDYGPGDHSHSCLGTTPHTIRGGLGDFRVTCTETEAFQHCICCSIPITQKYCSSDRLAFIAEAIVRSEMLEEVSGLTDMKCCNRGDEVMTFDDDDDDDDDEK